MSYSSPTTTTNTLPLRRSGVKGRDLSSANVRTDDDYENEEQALPEHVTVDEASALRVTGVCAGIAVVLTGFAAMSDRWRIIGSDLPEGQSGALTFGLGLVRDKCPSNDAFVGTIWEALCITRSNTPWENTSILLLAISLLCNTIALIWLCLVLCVGLIERWREGPIAIACGVSCASHALAIGVFVAGMARGYKAWPVYVQQLSHLTNSRQHYSQSTGWGLWAAAIAWFASLAATGVAGGRVLRSAFGECVHRRRRWRGGHMGGMHNYFNKHGRSLPYTTTTLMEDAYGPMATQIDSNHCNNIDTNESTVVKVSDGRLKIKIDHDSPDDAAKNIDKPGKKKKRKSTVKKKLTKKFTEPIMRRPAEFTNGNLRRKHSYDSAANRSSLIVGGGLKRNGVLPNLSDNDIATVHKTVDMPKQNGVLPQNQGRKTELQGKKGAMIKALSAETFSDKITYQPLVENGVNASKSLSEIFFVDAKIDCHDSTVISPSTKVTSLCESNCKDKLLMFKPKKPHHQNSHIIIVDESD